MLPVPYLAFLFGSQQGAATLAYEGRNLALLRAAPVGMGRILVAKAAGGLVLVMLISGYVVFAASAWQLQARLFPWVVAFPLLALSAVRLVLSVRALSMATATSSPEPSPADELALWNPVARRETARLIAWLAAFLVLIGLFSFLIGMPLAVLLYLKIESRERWPLALGLAAATSSDGQTVRAAWAGMEVTGWWAIVPLAIAALLTGLVMTVGTQWGVFRHYWVLLSLVLTLLCTVVLVLHMPTVSAMASLARRADGAELRALGALGAEILRDGLGVAAAVATAPATADSPAQQ
jgi:hypothetical protein